MWALPLRKYSRKKPPSRWGGGEGTRCAPLHRPIKTKRAALSCACSSRLEGLSNAPGARRST